MDDAPHILVVDDESPVRFAVADYLTRTGFRVDCAEEREEAEALLVARSYSAVITDIRLTAVHRSEGLEIVSFIRTCRPDVPVIVLTGYGSASLDSEARARGAAAVLQKPVALSEVAQLLHGLVGQVS